MALKDAHNFSIEHNFCGDGFVGTGASGRNYRHTDEERRQ
jgi:hypothetical protein